MDIAEDYAMDRARTFRIKTGRYCPGHLMRCHRTGCSAPPNRRRRDMLICAAFCQTKNSYVTRGDYFRHIATITTVCCHQSIIYVCILNLRPYCTGTVYGEIVSFPSCLSISQR